MFAGSFRFLTFTSLLLLLDSHDAQHVSWDFFSPHKLLSRLRVVLFVLLGAGGFVFRRAIEAPRAHYEVGIIDSDRDRAVIAVAPLVGRDVSQRILIV